MQTNKLNEKIAAHNAILDLDAAKHAAIVRNDDSTYEGILPFLAALRKYYNENF